MSVPRGIRNRNPLNIKYSPANKWQGLADPPSDGTFCRFTEDTFGIRAAATLLRAYRNRYHLQTIAELIERWAPAGDDNDPDGYAAQVAGYMGVDTDHVPDLNDPAEVALMLRGMTRVENGRGPLDGEWYPDTVWQTGVRLAVRPLTRSRTMAGGALAGGATAAQGVLDGIIEVLPQAADAANTVEYVWPEIARWVLIGVAIIGVAMVVYARWDGRQQGLI